MLPRISGRREESDYGRSALHKAAYEGNTRQMLSLLQRGFHPSSPSRLRADEGGHALHLASSRGHTLVVDLLLKKGADPDAKDNQGFSPLHVAALQGFVLVVRLLRKAGANLEAQTKTGLQAVHLAATNGHVQILHLLKSYRCNLAPLDFYSSSPLHRAAQSGQMEAVRWLVEAGVSYDNRDEEGKRAVDKAIEGKHIAVTEFLTALSLKRKTRKKSNDTDFPHNTFPSSGVVHITPPSPRPPAAPQSPMESYLSPLHPQSFYPTPNPTPDGSPCPSPIVSSSRRRSLSSPHIGWKNEPTKTKKKTKKEKILHMFRKIIPTCEDKVKEPSRIHTTSRTSTTPDKEFDPEAGGRKVSDGRAVGQSPLPVIENEVKYEREMPVMELQVKAASSPYPDGPDVYPCRTNPRGLVLILNNRAFTNEEHSTRFGSECDITNLENVFHQMGYVVRTRWDLTRRDTLAFFSSESQSATLRHVSSLFVFIMSHGDGPRTFITYDLAAVSLDEVQNYFLDQSCPNLKGKPKVFFSHFCRGPDEEIRPTLLPEARREAYRDMLCIYSSTEGFLAYRHPILGTPSIRALCMTLARSAHCRMICDLIKEFQELYETMEGATSPEVQNLSFKNFFLNPTGNAAPLR